MTTYLEYNDDEDLLKVNSTLVEVNNFVKSTLHNDFQREVDIRINMLTNMLDDFQQRYSGRDYDQFRGGKRVLLEMRNIFIDIVEGLVEQQEQEQQKGKE